MSRRGESDHEAMRRLKNEFLVSFDGVKHYRQTNNNVFVCLFVLKHNVVCSIKEIEVLVL